jgi:hypothetical protein
VNIALKKEKTQIIVRPPIQVLSTPNTESSTFQINPEWRARHNKSKKIIFNRTNNIQNKINSK